MFRIGAHSSLRDPYGDGRKLSEGHPQLALESLDVYTAGVESRTGEEARIEQVFGDLDVLVDTRTLTKVLVVGCGPRPTTVPILRRRGCDVIAVEPVTTFVEAARRFLGSPDRVLQGSAEGLPVADESIDLVFLESVLEHVESPRRSLEEVHRVLRRGGVALIVTTNRYSLSPRKAEFNARYFSWFPPLLRESYVYFHLHYRPSLANYTERPAVHWFSFADLCALGRDAGFEKFYSHLDLRRGDATSRASVKARLRSILLRGIQTSPLIRTLALTQRGGTIFMLKRSLTVALSERMSPVRRSST
jgi:SAM-dependent methyltransferase